MATATLPGSLHAKLTALARRMAVLRLARAAAGTVLVLAIVAGLGLLGDWCFRFASPVRFVLLAGWVVLAVLGVVRCLRNLNHRADVEGLAALIESEYPNLAERLTTSVELAEAGNAGHGSPALIEMLLRETEIRTSQLDFLQAAPQKTTYRRAALAGIALGLLLAPSAIWPATFIGHVQRLVMPWTRTPIGYEIVANPGDHAMARGQSLTISALLKETGATDELPTSAALVIIDENGKSTRLAMRNEQPGVFHCKLNTVASSFRYRVEAGDAASAEHAITAVDPVQLVGDNPTITITPPAYARNAVETRTITGLGDYSALQHSKLTYDFRFDRPAVAARIEWSENGDAKNVRELALGDGGRSARFETTALAPGRLLLILEAEHGIRTDLPPQALNVLIDHPPAFVRVGGASEQLRTVAASEVIPLDLTVIDDYGVDSIEIEYRINEGAVATEKVAIEGLGTAQAAGRHALRLAGRVKQDDTFQFRLKAADNRRVPEAKLTPQVVYHPAENRWFSFKIARNAEPLKQQEIAAQRDELRNRLDKLIERLTAEEKGLYSRRQEARGGQELTGETLRSFQAVRSEHQANEQTLNELARDTAQTPELRQLSNRLQDVSDREMRNATAALQQADRNRSKAPIRAQELEKARQEVTDAIAKLENLKKVNEQIAQQRLDQMKLEQLAERQKQLAEQAARETDPKKAEELAREQQRLADELKNLTEQSEALKQALEAAQAQHNKELADRARDLAQQQRDLSQAMNQTNREAMKGQLDDLARKQRDLADQAAKLAKDTEKPTAAAQSRPLDPEKPRDAADALDKGDPNTALTKQEQTAQDLDRLAQDLDKAIQLARDPREAARQLARLQDDLKNRTTNEARKTPLEQMARERLDALRTDQDAIRQAAERIAVPETNREARREQAEALQHAQRAAEELARKDQAKAEAHMTLAKDALQRLADRLPSLKDRLNAAADEVARLRQQQNEIATQAEQLAKQGDQKSADAEQSRRDLAQKLAEAARKQADAAERLGKLDAPTMEERQQRAQDAMNKALQDLLSARRPDIAASQGDARRQLERLEQALRGQKPVDEKAAELAQRQRELASQAERLAKDNKTTPENGQEMQKLQARQQQVAQETARLQPTEAAQRQAEAAEATRQAEKASREGGEQMARKTAEAARALERLAEQLKGAEDDARKADRLAKKQAELARSAEQLARKPDPAAREDQRKQLQQIQEEAKQLRGGDDAAREKQNADDALSRLSRSPEKTPDAQQKAADALQKLADKLAASNDARKPAPSVEQLAQQQRQLAQQTQQARREAGRQDPKQAQQAMQQLARDQARLGEQAGQTPNNQPKAMEQARQAMNQAEQALSKGDWSKAQQGQQEAGRALEQMARQQQAQQANNRPAQGQQTPASLPNKAQSDQARQLAQKQRDLRDEVQRAISRQAAQNQQKPPSNPAGELAREQQSIADSAQKLAEQQAQQNGQQAAPTQQARQAASAAQQTANQLQAGALPQAKQSGQQAAQQLQQLGQNNKGESGQQAQKLAQRQESVNRQLEKLAGNAQAQQAQQQARQQDLQQQTQDLARQMQQQANQMRGSPSQQAMQQAAQATQRADGAMQQAQRGQQQGNPSATQQSQQQAAQNLDRAAQLAQQAAGAPQQANGQPQPGSPQQQTGQALQQAQNQMGNAKQQLGQNQSQQAQGSMQKASQSLQQAAQSLAQQGQPSGQPPNGPTNKGDNDGTGAGAIDLARYGKDAARFQGKAWGELPGELRTRIIQDMRAQYGDDYGRMIKLYFEQLADKKPASR